MRLTIALRRPWAVSTPTVSPSRSTVARSHSWRYSAMRWEMKITLATAATKSPYNAEHALREIGRQRRSDLVDQQDGRIGRQRPREIDQTQDGKGKSRIERAKVEFRDAQVDQPFAHGLGRGRERGAGFARPSGPEPKRDPDRPTRCRPGAPRQESERRRLDPARTIPPPSAENTPVMNFDQGALARAVGAHQRMHFAGAHFQRSGLEGDHRVKALRDIRCREQDSVEVIQQSTAEWHSASEGNPKSHSFHLNVPVPRRRSDAGPSTRNSWLPRLKIPQPRNRHQLSPGPLQAFSWSGV